MGGEPTSQISSGLPHRSDQPHPGPAKRDTVVPPGKQVGFRMPFSAFSPRLRGLRTSGRDYSSTTICSTITTVSGPSGDAPNLLKGKIEGPPNLEWASTMSPEATVT